MQGRHLDTGNYVLAVERVPIGPQKTKVSENTKNDYAQNY